MGVPSDQLLGLMSKGGQGAAMPNAGAMPPSDAMLDAQTPPMASPMTTPEPKLGSKEGALISVSIACDLLEQAIPALGPDEPEGVDVLAAIRRLNKALGGKKRKVGELQNSELLQMIQTLPQAGGASPEMQALQKAPVPGLPQGGPKPPM